MSEALFGHPVLRKSFNLIPTSEKSTEFFQSVRIFPAVFVRIFEKVIWEHCAIGVQGWVPIGSTPEWPVEQAGVVSPLCYMMYESRAGILDQVDLI